MLRETLFAARFTQRKVVFLFIPKKIYDSCFSELMSKDPKNCCLGLNNHHIILKLGKGGILDQ